MSDSEDDMPLAQRARPAESSDDEDDVPLANRQAAVKPTAQVAAATNGHHANGNTNSSLAGTSTLRGVNSSDDSSSEDDVPLGKFCGCIRHKQLDPQLADRLTSFVTVQLSARRQ